MIEHSWLTRSKLRTFAISAMCLGLLAIGASSASAATGTTYNFTGTASNAFINPGSNGGIKCEKLTIAGQVTQPGSGTAEPKTGTVTNITPTNCINQFFNVQMAVSLKTPWTVSINSGNAATVTNFNLHIALAGAPQQVYFDMTGGTRIFDAALWAWAKPNTLTVKASSGAVGGFAANGPGYLEAVFPVTYTKVS